MLLSVTLPVGMALRHNSAPPPTTAPASQPSATTLTPTPAPRNIDGLLLIGWGIASLTLALFFAGIHRRMLAQLAPLQTRDVLGHTVTVSPDFGPAAVGLLRSRVVLPEWVFELPVEEQRLVLRHEQQHIDAGDHFVLLAGVVMTVLVPWNLGLWWQLRRLRVGMELDCDARVAPRAADRPRYGQLLLQSRTRSRSYHAALAFVPTPSVLAERLYALLESARLSRRQMATWSVSAIACAVVVTRVPVPDLTPLITRATPVAVIPVSTLSGVSAALPAPVSHTRAVPARRVVASHSPVAVPPPDTAPPAVARPRYDSLIPYVQGQPSVARGMRTGGGVGLAPGAVRAIIRTPPDSAKQLHN
jgi:beta-lactamase regulating signal transducer with metallopeptidase domain